MTRTDAHREQGDDRRNGAAGNIWARIGIRESEGAGAGADRGGWIRVSSLSGVPPQNALLWRTDPSIDRDAQRPIFVVVDHESVQLFTHQGLEDRLAYLETHHADDQDPEETIWLIPADLEDRLPRRVTLAPTSSVEVSDAQGWPVGRRVRQEIRYADGPEKAPVAALSYVIREV